MKRLGILIDNWFPLGDMIAVDGIWLSGMRGKGGLYIYIYI